MARLKDKSRIERSRKNLPANFFFAKKKEDSQENFVRQLLANIAKIARITNLTNFRLKKRNGEEGPREVRKFPKNRKSNKNFSCHPKRLSNKYHNKSRNKLLQKFAECLLQLAILVEFVILATSAIYFIHFWRQFPLNLVLRKLRKKNCDCVQSWT